MKINFIVRCATLVAILFLAVGLAGRAQAQPATATSNPNFVLLDDAYATLAQADHDYKGHRVLAMKQIELAVKELGSKISGNGKGHEPQATSDTQLKAAQILLQQAGTGLTGKALTHVNNAVKQINTALAIK